jgi:uncharacterized membrane protein YfcA
MMEPTTEVGTLPELPRIALLAGSAVIAGAVNAVAGGGSLISFPALLAAGYPAITANVTNTVALTPGYLGGTLGYRRQLAGQRRRALVLGVTSVAGALLGAWLLVISSAELFERIVPFLVFLACALLALQTRLARVVQERPERDGGPGAARALRRRTLPLLAAQFLAAVYGAYFGAGLGIMMLAVLGIFVADSLQRLNALKGVLQLVINVVGALYFALFANVVWAAVAVMAAASLLGGQAGVVLARRLNDRALRWLVIAFGVLVGTRLLLR